MAPCSTSWGGRGNNYYLTLSCPFTLPEFRISIRQEPRAHEREPDRADRISPELPFLILNESWRTYLFLVETRVIGAGSFPFSSC